MQESEIYELIKIVKGANKEIYLENFITESRIRQKKLFISILLSDLLLSTVSLPLMGSTNVYVYSNGL